MEEQNHSSNKLSIQKVFAFMLTFLLAYLAGWAADYKFLESMFIIRGVVAASFIIVLVVLAIKLQKNHRKFKNLVLPMLLAVSISACAYMYIEYSNTLKSLNVSRNELIDFQVKVGELTEQISELKTENANLKNSAFQKTEEEQENARKALFLDNQIALVVYPYGEVYHRYDCHHFQNCNSYLAYNIDAAKSLGYEPCAICH